MFSNLTNTCNPQSGCGFFLLFRVSFAGGGAVGAWCISLGIFRGEGLKFSCWIFLLGGFGFCSRLWGPFLAWILRGGGDGGGGGDVMWVWALSLVHPSTLAMLGSVTVWTLSLVHPSGILDWLIWEGFLGECSWCGGGKVRCVWTLSLVHPSTVRFLVFNSG